MLIGGRVVARVASRVPSHALRRVASSASPLLSVSFSTPLITSLRLFARVSPLHGAISAPPGGFITSDVGIDTNTSFGGAYARGVFAKREISFGREVMSIPAFTMYVSEHSDEKVRDQVLILTKQVFTKLVTGTPEEKQYIKHRVMTMMSGGVSYFSREKDVFDFAEEVRAPGPEGAFKNGVNYLQSGDFSSYDLQKLPLVLEFNRVEVEYRGRRGICIFPEASYFNHSCEPNVELSITYNSSKNNFFLSARACRPIREGEELFINYMPGNTLPLSRLALAMKHRWGFECTCVRCKSRAIGAVTIIFVVMLIPITVFIRYILVGRAEEKRRSV